MSIGPRNVIPVAGRAGRLSIARLCRTVDRSAPRRLVALALALAISVLVVPPALGAEPGGGMTVPRQAVQNDDQDATDGGYQAQPRRVIFPSVELGLSRQRPIPLGATCSCTIDRVGLISQFDITVLTVDTDAIALVQQLNRFNKPPRPGARYLAAYVGQQYIAGPQNQAYTTSEADWKATTTDERLSDVAQLFHVDVEYRPKADVYPGNFVNGWLVFELPVNRPAVLVWNYSFLGERGVWFALQ